MNNELILQLIQLLMGNSTSTPISSTYPIGKKIILRGYDSGVIFGELVSVTNGVYQVKNARRLYYWQAVSGICLEDVAVHGIKSTSKLTCVVPLCDITDARISLLLPCSEASIKSIEECPVYQP